MEVRRLFPHASLIAEPGGTSHADSLFGDTCVDGSIAEYLTEGTLPPRRPDAQWDKTCAPLPQPDPTAPAPMAKMPTTPGSSQALQFTNAVDGRLGLAAVLSR